LKNGSFPVGGPSGDLGAGRKGGLNHLPSPAGKDWEQRKNVTKNRKKKKCLVKLGTLVKETEGRDGKQKKRPTGSKVASGPGKEKLGGLGEPERINS